MKRITDFISGLRSLGVFGLIFFLMALALAVGAFAALFNFINEFDTVTAHIEALRVFQDDVGYSQGQAQIDEVYLQFYIEQEFDISELYASILSDYEAIQNALLELDEFYDFAPDSATFSAQTLEARQGFEAQLDSHLQLLSNWKALYDSGEVDLAYESFPALREDAEFLSQSLDDLVVTLEKGRTEAARGLPSDVSLAVWGVSLSLVALLLLALWGYRQISGITQPLLALTNVVYSIGGDQYRKELLQNLERRGDLTGALAKALDSLAQGQQNNTSGLKQEVNRLREQMYASRRSRLKLYRANPAPAGQTNPPKIER